MTPDRRRMLGGTVTLAAVSATGGLGVAWSAEVLPGLDEATRTWLKLVSDLSGRPTFAVETGAVWGFKPQADDLSAADFGKRLYGYIGLMARKAETISDGVAVKTKGWTFYTHPETGLIVTEVLNPYTGRTVQCPPLSGPVSTARYGPGQSSSPPELRQHRLGDRAWVEVSRLSRFKPRDTTWFKLEADLVNYACRTADLDDPAATSIPSTWSHNVVAEWQTWMQMHATPGNILFKGDGAFVNRLQDAPTALLAAIDQYFPSTLDDVRSWARRATGSMRMPPFI